MPLSSLPDCDLPNGFTRVEALEAFLGDVRRQICCIDVRSAITEEWEPCGTGFLVGQALVLTNFHVIKDPKKSNSNEIDPDRLRFRFDYYENTKAPCNEGTVFSCRETSPLIKWSPAPPQPEADFDKDGGIDFLDYALLGLDMESDRDDGGVPVHRGWILAQAASSRENPTAIAMLQHPAGHQLMQAVSEPSAWERNKNCTRVQYLIKSLPGSSGSPVFDKKRRLVALHHAGTVTLAEERRPRLCRGIPIDKICEHINVPALHLADPTPPQRRKFPNSRLALLEQVERNWVADYGKWTSIVLQKLPLEVRYYSSTDKHHKIQFPLRDGGAGNEAAISVLERFGTSDISVLLQTSEGDSYAEILVELVDMQCRLARLDETARIPVVFQATGWLTRPVPPPDLSPAHRFEQELVDQLHARYYAASKIARHFVRNNAITVFVDGFAELIADSPEPALVIDLLEEMTAWAQASAARQLCVVMPYTRPPELEHFLSGKLVMAGGHWVNLDVVPVGLTSARQFLQKNLGLRDGLVKPLFDSRIFQNLSRQATFLHVFYRAAGASRKSRDGFVSTIIMALAEPGQTEDKISTMVQDRWLNLALEGGEGNPDKTSVQSTLAWVAAKMDRRNRLFYLDRVPPSWLGADPKVQSAYQNRCAILYGMYLGGATAIFVLASLSYEHISGGGKIADAFSGAALAGVGVLVVSGLAYRFASSSLCLGAALGASFGWARGINKHFSLEDSGSAFVMGLSTAVGAAILLGVVFQVKKLPRDRIQFVEAQSFRFWHALAGLGLIVPSVLFLPMANNYRWGGISLALATGLCAAVAIILPAPGLPARVQPNQGFFTSLRLSLICSGSLSLVTIASLGLGYGIQSQGNTLRDSISNAILGFAMLTTAVIFGLQPVIQHFELRRMLHRKEKFPFPAVPLLDHCVRRGILRRVGGGYLFAFEALRKHFREKRSAEV